MRLFGPKRAAVLGCGPAGLFAAHALIQNGWDVTVFSKRRKSHLYGAQYLHVPIPRLTPDDAEPVNLKYVLTGSVDEYREKVYGANPVNTSVEALDSEHLGWDLRVTYDAAWSRYEEIVENVELGAPIGHTPFRDFRIVLSSIPLDRICYRRHQFHSVQVWAIGDAPDRGQTVPYRPAENTVECNGTRDVGWYRASNVYGHATMEWPGRSKPPIPGVAQVTKPISTDCDCYRKGELGARFIPIGRYGAWQKSILTHHAYTRAVQL